MISWRQLPRHKIFKLINFWPPYLGAGVRLSYVSPDFRHVRVEMPLTRLNRNYVGVHFGGSLYALVDPWYMLMLLEVLGRDYVVWDKAATIRFRKPGRGTVWAEFTITDEQVQEIRQDVQRLGKTERTWPVVIQDGDGITIAEVTKTLWIGAKK